MIGKTVPAKTHAGACFYGNHCCPNALHTAKHKKRRRMLKRAERQAWKRELART